MGAILSTMHYTERVQTLLTVDQLATLKDLATEHGSTVSALVREAVESTYLLQARRAQRRAALQTLIAIEAPTGEWEQLEQEIESGASGDLPGASHDQPGASDNLPDE